MSERRVTIDAELLPDWKRRLAWLIAAIVVPWLVILGLAWLIAGFVRQQP